MLLQALNVFSSETLLCLKSPEEVNYLCLFPGHQLACDLEWILGRQVYSSRTRFLLRTSLEAEAESKGGFPPLLSAYCGSGLD